MDLTELKDILRILEEQDITEFELEHDGVKLRVCRGPAPSAAPTVSYQPAPGVPAVPWPPSNGAEPAAPAAPAPPATASPEAAEEEAQDETPDGNTVPSPIVGTFYRSPDPTSPPFVNVGDRVQVGQVLCIIEAMKLMNEIEAETAGEIVKIHPENGQPVQYGDSLFTIRPA